MYFYMKYNYFCFSFSVVHFFKGTSVSITLYLFEHYQLWMMDSKAQRVFFENTPKLCVWPLKSQTVIILNSVRLFQSQNPKMGSAGYQVK